MIELSLAKVLKKINFMLELKGMNIGDWINAVEYESGGKKDDIRISDLIHVWKEWESSCRPMRSSCC